MVDSRESSQPFRRQDSEEQRSISFGSLPGKLRRGWSSVHGEKGDAPKEVNPRRVAVSVSFWLTATRTLAGSKTLEWESSGTQPQEGNGVRKNVLLCGWKSALKGNPMGGTGMKQGRQMVGGAKP